jgi:Hint domain
MTTQNITTSGTTVTAASILGTDTINVSPSLTGVQIDIAVALAGNIIVNGGADSHIVIDNTLGVLSGTTINTNGADITYESTPLLSATALSGTTINIDGGTFETEGNLVNVSLASAAHVNFQGTAASTYAIESASPGSFISLNLLNSVGPITGMGTNDSIVDQNLNYSDITGYSITGTKGGTETITVNSSDGSNLTFALANASLNTGSYGTVGGPLNLSNDGGGLQLTLCFLGGTMITTPDGEAAVETLNAGDLITTADGRTVPVRWIGINTVSTRFADLQRNMPVRITAGALGEGLPKRDLLVSPDHALFLDGVLVQANALLNDITIHRETRMPEVFRYYHVEMAAHDLILAEGVAAETFVDNVSRMAFDNWEEFMELCQGEPPTGEMAYPRAKSQRQVPEALRAYLAARVTQLQSRTAA